MKAAEVPEVPRPEKQMFFPAYMGAEHMNDLVRAIQCQLTEKWKYCVAYSVAIDDSTEFKHIAQLVVSTPGVREEFQLVEDLRNKKILEIFFPPQMATF